MRHPNVRNIDELDIIEQSKGRHRLRLRQLGKPSGSQLLGATIAELPPGAISFPRHAHLANEEAIYVLSGTGEAVIGETRVPVRAGDWIALPMGRDHAHQMANVSDAPLVYLCVSTMNSPDVVEYPDSGKTAIGIVDPSTRIGYRRLAMFETGTTLDYWHNEPGAKE
jgi:uncharacterized cupin superfamily protein